MFERIIPEIVHEYDPQTFYWPASPSSGGCLDEPNDPNRGDVHYWKVWHGNRPFTEYRKYFFRYLSEFGFQAFPSVKTIEQFTDNEEDMNPFSYIMEKHQRQYSANGKIMGYMQQTYKYPNSFPTFVYASQLLQADGIRYGVEHFRRNRGRCMGAVYWQLNDCWPVISWSSVDYCGRLKALHYYAKRFFAPLMISCEEQGMMSSEANMNREHFVFEKSIRLNVANETMQDQNVTVRWALRDPSAAVLESGEQELTVPALTSTWLDKVEFPDADIFSHYVSYELICDGKVVSEGTVNFSYPKYFRYEDPELTCRVEGDEIVVSAKAYAKSVEILNENEDLVLEDNYFDLNANEKRVKVISGSTETCVCAAYTTFADRKHGMQAHRKAWRTAVVRIYKLRRGRCTDGCAPAFQNQDYGRKQREGRLLCYSIKKKRLRRDNRRGQNRRSPGKCAGRKEENRQKRGWKGFRIICRPIPRTKTIR